MTDNDIARRGYMNVVRNPRDGVVSTYQYLVFHGLHGILRYTLF